MAADRLEREAWRRAVEGWEEPVYPKGQLVGTVRLYSDTLLALLLRAARPKRYREQVDLASESGRPSRSGAAANRGHGNQPTSS